MIHCLSFFLISSRSSSTPFYPQNVASQGACPNYYSSIVFTSNSYLNLLRSLGVRHLVMFLLPLEGEMNSHVFRHWPFKHWKGYLRVMAHQFGWRSQHHVYILMITFPHILSYVFVIYFVFIHACV
jgi:hypothetical protein